MAGRKFPLSKCRISKAFEKLPGKNVKSPKKTNYFSADCTTFSILNKLTLFFFISVKQGEQSNWVDRAKTFGKGIIDDIKPTINTRESS